ncbi:MAG TPA: VWA domain-containing protein [Pyrinomonadaceae bacterium]|nr:VWA domain-containing protein [Pyrinomonadaceae bacterium]
MSKVVHSGNLIRSGAAAAALALTLVLGAGGVASRARRQQPRPKPGEEEEVVRVETRLVGIPFTVRSRGGGYVGDLRRDELRVYEDGVEQRVTHFESAGEPINVVLLLDFSPSVRADLPAAREAAAAFLEQLRPDDRVGAVAFASEAVVLFGGGVGDRGTLREAILKSRVGGAGATALHDAVIFTLTRVVGTARGRKAVLLFTDGWDTSSRRGSLERSLNSAEESDAPVHVVWLGEGIPGGGSGPRREGESYLRELARRSGGRFQLAGGRDGMVKTLASVAEELRAQYQVGFYASGELRPGKRRKLKVVVTRAGVSVRAKESYVVPESGGARP